MMLPFFSKDIIAFAENQFPKEKVNIVEFPVMIIKLMCYIMIQKLKAILSLRRLFLEKLAARSHGLAKYDTGSHIH